MGEGLSAEDSAKLKGNTITLLLDVGDMYIYGYGEHMDAIKYMGGVIAERLGRMYGLRILIIVTLTVTLLVSPISIASRGPKYYHSATPVSASLAP